MDLLGVSDGNLAQGIELEVKYDALCQVKSRFYLD